MLVLNVSLDVIAATILSFCVTGVISPLLFLIVILSPVLIVCNAPSIATSESVPLYKRICKDVPSTGGSVNSI